MNPSAPTQDQFLAMTTAFYEAAIEDDVIGDMFSRAATDHATHLASWLAVVFGLSNDYLRERGDIGFVMYKHMGLGITEGQRARWARLMTDAAANTFTDETFLRRYGQFVNSITHNVREMSNLEPDALRSHIGLAPGENLSPISEKAHDQQD